MDRLRDRLVAWCEIPSGSNNAAGLAAMANALEGALARVTGDVERVDLTGAIAPAVRARVRPNAPVQVLLVGHYDTVYAAGDPFARCTAIDADTLGGPGAADMKGGLVVMLEALSRFEAGPGHAGLGWEVVIVPDEEIGSPHSREFLREIASRHHVGLVVEPALPDGRVVRARKGTGHVQVDVHGRAAHAGRDPAAGRSAILALSELLLAVDRVAMEVPEVLMNIGVVIGGGVVNVVPDRASAEINLRAGSRESAEHAVALVRTSAAAIAVRREVRIDVEGGLTRPPKHIDAATQALFDRYRAGAAARGVVIDWTDVGGGSDGSTLADAGLPTLDGLGVVGDGLHSAAERCRVSSIGERAQLITDLLVDLAGG